MRKLSSHETSAQARAVASALAREGIRSEVREQSDQAHAVWVLDEDQQEAARAVLAAWTENPTTVVDDDLPAEQALAAPSPVPSAHPAAPRPRARGVHVSLRLRSAGAPLTTTLLAISALVALVSDFGTSASVLEHLTIKRDFTVPSHLYDDLRSGELWRAVTPVFIHFGFLHLAFNAFWLLDLGAAIERTWGPWRLGFMLLVSAVVSNVAQLYLGKSAAFGGLSGLIYACMGYLWARGRFDPTSPIGAPRQLVTFFVIYLALGFSGVLDGLGGKMANYCHLGGFVSGVACGMVSALLVRHRMRRSTQA